CGEASFDEVYIVAQIAATLRGIVGCQLRSDPAHSLHRGGEIDADRRCLDPQHSRAARLRACACRSDECFRGYTTEVKTISAHEVAFDYRDPCSKAGGPHRGAQARPSR